MADKGHGQPESFPKTVQFDETNGLQFGAAGQNITGITPGATDNTTVYTKGASDDAIADALGGVNFDYYFSDTAEGVIADYDLMYVSDTGESESTAAQSITGTGILIQSFITETNEPTFTTLVEGVYGIHIHAAKTSGIAEVFIYAEFYKRASGGSETLLATSEDSPELTGSNAGYDLHFSLAQEEALLTTDRLVVKFYGTKVGGATDPTATLYLEGDNASRVEVRTTASALDGRYAVKQGLSGGQSLSGGTDASDDLTLGSTTDGTKGVVQIATGDNFTFEDGGASITEISDDVNMADDSATKGVTQHAAKTYIDNNIHPTLEPVLDFVNFVTSEPGSPTVGDRYINTTTGTSSIRTETVTATYLYEDNGVTWTETIPVAGDKVYDNTSQKFWIYSGTAWVVDHESLAQKQIIYVGDAGNDANSGTSNDDPVASPEQSTVLAAAQTPAQNNRFRLNILDGGNYSINSTLTIPSWCEMIGPAAYFSSSAAIEMSDDSRIDISAVRKYTAGYIIQKGFGSGEAYATFHQYINAGTFQFINLANGTLHVDFKVAVTTGATAPIMCQVLGGTLHIDGDRLENADPTAVGLFAQGSGIIYSNIDRIYAISNNWLQIQDTAYASVRVHNVRGAISKTGAAKHDLDIMKDGDGNRIIHQDSGSVEIYGAEDVHLSPRMTTALQPYFDTYKSSDTNNATGNGTVFTIIYDTENHDIGSNYNNATGVFTAPLDGRYLFTGSARVENLHISLTRYYMRLSCSNESWFSFEVNPNPLISTTGEVTLSLSKYVYMDAGDTANVDVTVSGGAQQVTVVGSTHTYTHFSGGLIC